VINLIELNSCVDDEKTLNHSKKNKDEIDLDYYEDSCKLTTNK
jgi:hypothetical protein